MQHEVVSLKVVLGMAYGGVMPLYAVPVGPLAGGWSYDTFHTYTWLYLGACGIGIGAVAIASSFPPLTTFRYAPAVLRSLS
jgi:hypothetical protein